MQQLQPAVTAEYSSVMHPPSAGI